MRAEIFLDMPFVVLLSGSLTQLSRPTLMDATHVSKWSIHAISSLFAMIRQLTSILKNCFHWTSITSNLERGSWGLEAKKQWRQVSEGGKTEMTHDLLIIRHASRKVLTHSSHHHTNVSTESHPIRSRSTLPLHPLLISSLVSSTITLFYYLQVNFQLWLRFFFPFTPSRLRPLPSSPKSKKLKIKY